MLSNNIDLTVLKEQYQKMKAENPRLRNKDAANALSTSEAQLVALGLGENAIKLKGNWEEMVTKLKEFGYVMCLTRNESCVHERKGEFLDVAINPVHQMGTVLGPDIDLRIFFRVWSFAFAVTTQAHNRTLESIQFFDGKGDSIFKVYLQEKSNREAYLKFIEEYKDDKQDKVLETLTNYPIKTYKNINEIDQREFRKDWANLQDTHDFHILLAKYGINRTDALTIAGEFAYKLDNDKTRLMLETAAKYQTDIMVFVGNHGMIQIHTGKVNNINEIEEYLNVMDPEFNMHLKIGDITETWVVKKPTTDGIVTSLELFDKDGNLVVTFFGKRKPGSPELEEWRKILNEISIN